MSWFKILKYALVGFLICLVALWHYQDKKQAVEAVIMEIKAQSEAEARVKEQVLTYNAYQLGREKDEKIATINGKLAAALRLLSQRPTRPANPSATSNGEACTGTKLFREDAEFLTREASRADQLAVERDYYYEQYEDARRTLAGEK